MLYNDIISETTIMAHTLFNKPLKLTFEVFNAFGQLCRLFLRATGYKTVGDVSVAPIGHLIPILCNTKHCYNKTVKVSKEKVSKDLRDFHA